jgi:hypothetical protein
MIDGGRVSRLAWLVLFNAAGSGCTYVFDLDQPLREDARGPTFDATDAGAGDATSDAATACVNPIFFDSFSATSPCAPWGSAYTTTTALEEANGVLSITPNIVAGSVGGCLSSSSYAFGNGVTAIVDETLQGPGAYTVLGVHGADMQINVASGMLRYQTTSSTDVGVVTYTSAMKWWRIRPSGANVIGEYSMDGTSWVALGTTNASPAQVSVEIAAGSNNGGNVGKALFDELMICP